MPRKNFRKLVLIALFFTGISCLCFILFLLTFRSQDDDIITPEGSQPEEYTEKNMVDCLEPVVTTVKYVKAEPGKTALSVTGETVYGRGFILNGEAKFSSKNTTSTLSLYTGDYDLEYFYENEWQYIGKPKWADLSNAIPTDVSKLAPGASESDQVIFDKVNCAGINSKYDTTKVKFISGRYRYTLPTYSEPENPNSNDPQVLESIFYYEFSLQ